MRIHISNPSQTVSNRLVSSANQPPTVSENQAKIFGSESLPPSNMRDLTPKPETLEEALFDNRATVKVLTSRVSMHLSRQTRDDLFRQIDELLDQSAWDDEDSLINEASFVTFLRFLISEPLLRRPALSVSLDGNVMVSWITSVGRLTIEFLQNDQVRLVAHHSPESASAESLAFEGSLKSIETILSPIKAVGLFREKA